AGTISGASGSDSVCVAATLAFSTTGTSGGVWSSSNTSIASVDAASGLVSGVAAGTATISYIVTTPCGTDTATLDVRVDALPDAGAITGGHTVCNGATLSLSNTATGGTWSTSDATVASVDGAGLVTSVAAGTATISYVATTGCATATDTQMVTVLALPTAGTITGAAGSDSVCIGSALPLTASGTSGGAWSSSDVAIASVNATSGVVNGIAGGSATITYITSNTCGSDTATFTIRVNNLAPDAGTITGTSPICVGNTSAFTETVSGGTWSTDNAAVASIDAAGTVTGVASGSATISYSVPAGACSLPSVATYSVTVTTGGTVGAITGSPVLCAGFLEAYTDTTTGGTWSTSDATVASIDASGNVLAGNVGTAILTYSVNSTCGVITDTMLLTVNDIPTVPAIIGTTPLCVGSTSLFTNAMAGGVWTTNDATIASVDATGNVTGVADGSTYIVYTVSNTCGDNFSLFLLDIGTPGGISPIFGATPFCTGTTISLSNGTPGGNWSTSDASIASIDASGVVYGGTPGTATITYSYVTPCATIDSYATVTVEAVPVAGVIIGTPAVCTGTSTTLTDATGTGTWSSSDPTVATIDPATGTVTGVAAGVAIITYGTVNSCGVVYDTMSVNVDIAPVVAPVTGAPIICVGVPSTFTDATPSGTWSTSNSAVATVDATGNVTGLSAGIVDISYTVFSICGPLSQVATVTVDVAPDPGVISGATGICAGNTTTLSETVSTGSWSSSDPTIADVDAAGVVTAYSLGTVIISYSVTNSCTTLSDTMEFTVDDIPAVAGITGAPIVCVGATTTLTDLTPGGVWSSSDPAVASVNTTGDVNGITTGTILISYSVTNGCGTYDAVSVVTVDDIPVVPHSTGSPVVCAGGTTTLANALPGGTWSTSDATIASVDLLSGTVYGGTVGSTLLTYTVGNTCGSSFDTINITTITVPAPPSAISGSVSSVCRGTTTLLTDVDAGGTWSSSAPGTADVDATGLVTSYSAGTAVISYSYSNVCGASPATYTLTILDTPVMGTIVGGPVVCVGVTSLFTNTTAGGSWSSSNTAVASVDATGNVTGVSAGSATITYAATNTCGTGYAYTTVNINPFPSMAPVTGGGSVCTGGSIALSDITPGGTWSTSNATVASVDNSGNVTGLSRGTAIISYRLVNGCGPTDSTATVVINDIPVIGSIAGVPNVCLGAVNTFTDTTTGGTWSTTNAAVASVDATGNVYGVALGAATISYSVTNFCGTNDSVYSVNVTPAPDAGVISGTAAICAGTSTTLSETSAGGVWSSSNTAIATVSTTGDVTGITRGTVDITYTVTLACGAADTTFSFTVDSIPAVPAIVGLSSVCEGSSISLSNAIFGGTWTSADTNLAVVDASGSVLGRSGGAVDITYTVTNYCGTGNAIQNVTVNPLPRGGILSGTTTFCAGTTSTLTSTISGGRWSSADATIATVDTTSGVVTGVAEGVVNITYTTTNGCGVADSVITLTINDVPVVASITGTTALCPAGTATLADATTGGVWTTGNAAIASVDATGNVTAVAADTVSIYYSVTNVCGTTTTSTLVTVNPVPVVGAIAGPATVCVGATVTLTDAVTGGGWTSSNTAVASVDTATGMVYGVGTGTAIITYNLTTACGSDSDTALITVNDRPVVGAITGTNSICAGFTTVFADTTAGGTWVSADTTIATVSATGLVTGVRADSVDILYQVTNGCGTTTASRRVYVRPIPVLSPIVGPSTMCQGAYVRLRETVAGGTWSTSNFAVASVDVAGYVTAVAPGTATITYSYTSAYGCASYVTFADTVLAAPSAGVLSGSHGVMLGSTTTLTSTVTGGVWTTANAAIASVNSTTGVVYGVSNGTTTITYTVTNTNGCSAIATWTMGVAPAITGVVFYPTGTATLCGGNPVDMFIYNPDTANSLTYQWYFNGTPISGATDSTYSATAPGYFSCEVTNAGGSVMIGGVTVSPQPNPIISMTAAHVLYTGSFVTYQWLYNGVAVPGANGSVLTSLGAGYYNVIVTDINGCTDTSLAFIDSVTTGVGQVNMGDATVRIFPNPASSVIHIEANTKVNIAIVSADGKLLIRKDEATTVDVSELAAGMYIINVYDSNNRLITTDRFIKSE
ncbi:MAG: T9SS C-terminal target domain-containing protein, partial [Chitinophagia bacterium]|nr:T9SS C-terminal target domain-containing protein [Chitinophagia bacterium]